MCKEDAMNEFILIAPRNSCFRGLNKRRRKNANALIQGSSSVVMSNLESQKIFFLSIKCSNLLMYGH